MFARVLSVRASPARGLHFPGLSADPYRPQVVSMPALSPTMQTGAIVTWQKKVGDPIQIGDVIAELETDKAKMGFETTDEGYIAKFLVEEGTTGIPVGSPIAIVVENKEDIAKYADYVPPSVSEASSSPSEPIAAPSKSNYPRHEVLGLPALSPNMEAGKIASWTKRVGDRISTGESIADIETDKATVPFEATDDYYIAKILVQPGTVVPVGHPIAVVVEDKADIDKFADFSLDDVANRGSPSKAAPQPSAAPSPLPSSRPASLPSASAGSSDRVLASPKAKVAAKEKGIDLSQVRGTGPNGRIIFADVEEFVPAPKTEETKARPAATTTAPSISSAFTDIPSSNIRKIIAERLLSSKQNIPHYYLTMECNADNLLALRQKLNDMAKGEYKLSVNDFVVKAAAVALKAVPEVNSEWRDSHIRRYHNVDINVAVNTDKGLLTPIVRDCDKIGLATISNTVKAVAGRAQEGSSTLDDLQTGTFTISNLGMFGIKQFCAVINPPQAAILAVGGIDQKPVLVTNDPEAGPKFTTTSSLTVTLSCDHRVVDGAVGAKWLQVFKDVIENPIKFLL